ncbi:MAG: peptidylprolyl isomerase [Alphaproteobacteria bacterium]
MRIFVLALFFWALVIALVLPVPVYARTEGIAAVVNQDAISITDLNDRLRMVIASARLPGTKDIQEKIMPQVLNDLIEEQLKMQEARRQEIEISQEEINQGLTMIARQNNLSMEQFRSAMEHDGISVATLERQIKAQIGWSKVIQKTMRPQVTITDSDIDDYIGRLKSASGKSEYKVAEIFLPVGENSPEADAQQLANRLVQEINSGKAEFFKVAQQFSSSAGAERGGDLGWVREGQLQPELDKALGGMQKEAVSNPVRTTDGYHILLLRDMRTVSEETIPSREQVMQNLGLQRLERMQARQLLELKTTAFIETRVET